jgi:hypothetical protein
MMPFATCAYVVCFFASRCTGKERDAESGNDYFEARYYSSAMGRFMSPGAPGLDSETWESTTPIFGSVSQAKIPLTNPASPKSLQADVICTARRGSK